MITKEELVFNKVIEQFRYTLYNGANQELRNLVISIFNNLGYGFKVYPAGDYYDSDEVNDELVMIDEYGDQKGLDAYDFIGLIKPEDKQKFLTPKVINALSDSDITDSFDEYVEKNYPDAYNEIDTLDLYDLGYRTRESLFEADWDHVVELLHGKSDINQQKEIRPLSEAKVSRIKRDIINSMIDRNTKKGRK